jgi:hypothetical protein
MPIIVDEVVISVELADDSADEPNAPPSTDGKRSVFVAGVGLVLDRLRDRERKQA